MNKEQAHEALKQLARSANPTGKLKAMIGAGFFSFDSESVMFKFKLCRHSNWCKIALNSLDLYDVTFIKTHGSKRTETKKYTGLYDDMLTSAFEEHTGLTLTMPRIYRA